jgi:hypothetical protein
MMVLVPYWELMQQPRLQAELVHDPLHPHRLGGRPPLSSATMARSAGTLAIAKAEEVPLVPLVHAAFLYSYMNNNLRVF